MNMKKMIAALMSAALACGAIRDADAAFRTFPAAAVNTDNPFNKQNDKEVPYDGSRWVQPVEWNVPTINPRDYNGGIMLFFDKIGLEPDYALGKTQRVYFSIVGAEVPVSMMKFHIFYDTRLKIQNNTKGEVVTAGKAVSEFTIGSAMIKDGQLAFYAYSDKDVDLNKGCIFTIDFIIPENAEPGDLYPIGLSYVEDGIVCDSFINAAKDEAGKLQMTYVFTKGIYSGYIKVMGEKKPVRGDTDGDREVSVADAQLTLKAYTTGIAGNDMNLTDKQIISADVNNDGEVSVDDAQYILRYYTQKSVAGTDITWEDLIGNTQQAAPQSDVKA